MKKFDMDKAMKAGGIVVAAIGLFNAIFGKDETKELKDQLKDMQKQIDDLKNK